uniref:Uncharacterized protein n=1 Tax=Sphaerodactylus townsendi TaxID=933632 RepID=A0ACB8FJU2_9SAUR
MISRSVQFEENEMAMSPEGAHDDQTKPQQDWLIYPVANDAQRDDTDLNDNQDVFDEPEEIPDVDVEPEYLPIPAAVAEGKKSQEMRGELLQTYECANVCILLLFLEIPGTDLALVQEGSPCLVLLIVSGNLSFLNWLTLIPSLACFDDASLGFLFSSQDKSEVLEIQREESKEKETSLRYGCYIRKVVNISFGILIAYLSVPVVVNLFSSRQIMNTSFNPLRIVNTYGAFGSITKERTEVIIQGTSSPDPSDPAAVWEEYEFKCKPGNLHRRPCFISPYHYRLDWLMWFAAFQRHGLTHLWGVFLSVEVMDLLEKPEKRLKSAQMQCC